MKSIDGRYSDKVKFLYDRILPEGQRVRDLIFPEVFGPEQYVGQYSDNTADQILALGRRVDITSKTHILDVGCGCCGPALHLAESFGCRITGVDLSEVHLSRARSSIERRGLSDRIRLIEGDIFEVAPNLEPVDAVIGLGAWCHLPPQTFFPLCKQLLRAGGRIAFMERVRLGPVDAALYRQLTTEWAAPSVETFASYYFALSSAMFRNVYIEDLTPAYKALQRHFIEVRLRFREKIEEIAGADYFQSDMELVSAETEATEQGLLGYGLFVADA
jgi:cyclopropane fatty-acyl-phospholipid synthase-like methyltransferase